MTPEKFTEGMAQLHDEAEKALETVAKSADGGATKYLAQAKQKIMRRLYTDQLALIFEVLAASGYSEGIRRMEATFDGRKSK